MTTVHLLSGGAAQGLVTQLEARFQQQHQAGIDACFGAVGLMRDNLLSGAPCDLVILTEALVTALAASGDLVHGSAQALGVV
ncbi:MAG: ABC transporter substrate-binding protein, partial [Polaromonas sp.]|nr:ABC transporter substrate-binding protein [Polaromonas sp.]